MTATNHALTGALIGLMIGNPVLALPVAFGSHFILDAIPHFGFNQPDHATLVDRRFARLLIGEAIVCFGIVVVLSITQPAHWLTAAFSAFAAASPDFMWIPRFIRAHRGKPMKQNRHLLAFHSKIQWFQRPIGSVVELTWCVGATVLLVHYL